MSPEYVPEEDGTFTTPLPAPRGRGAVKNPPNRFVPLEIEADPEEGPPGSVPTRFFLDHTKSVITTNQSPDVGIEASINPYRGCEHGCSYCFARPTHEYLELSAGVDFETKIWVKENAPELLKKELSSPKYVPRVLALSGITDPYQPVEKRLKLTRRILEVLVEFKNPVAIITKNHLVTRDADLLAELAKLNAAVVYLSITTLDDSLRNKLEPRTSSPSRRLDAVRMLTEHGIPAGVMMAPIIPGLTDSEIPALLNAAAEAGAIGAGYTMLRLPYQVAPLFEAWLETHYPDRKDKILNRIRSVRGGKLNDPRFGSRMRGEGFFADEVEALFRLSRRRAGLIKRSLELSTAHFRVPGISQGDLFSEDS